MPLVFYSTQEAAARIQDVSGRSCTGRYVAGLCKTGLIKASRVGHEYLILADDVDAYALNRPRRGRPKIVDATPK